MTKQSFKCNIDKQIAESLQCLKPEVEKALLSNPLVDDCAVIIRETQTRQPELVAYIVSKLPISLEQIQSQVQQILPSALIPKTYVPVSTIPLTDTGQVNETTLASLEVIDSDTILRVEERLGLFPEIERFAVVVEPLVKTVPPLHLDDLFSQTQANAIQDSQLQAQATTPSQKIENERCLERFIPTSDAKKLSISYGEPLHYPQGVPKTLQEVLQRAAQKSTKGIIYIQPDSSEVVKSYQELWQDALRILAGLKKLGLTPQDKVIFQLEHNQDFIPAFWGCILGGFVPVLMSIAPTYEQANSVTSKLQNSWQMLEKPLVLTSASLAPKIRGLSRLLKLENFQVEIIDELRDCEPDFNWHNSLPEDLAILLLTSGTTGTPKAVMQSHRSLISCCVGIATMHGFKPEDVWLHWVPLDHVGGIVMCHIKSVYLGCLQIHASTELVLQQPTRWLDWISRYRATITWAPNFAYGLINEQLEKLKTQATPTWDLSSMRFIINGAEAIIAKTARKFLQLLTPHQLPATAMHPAWGMAETSSGTIYSDTFLLNSTTDEQKFVEVGAPIPGFAMRIVDAQNQVVEEETIGRLQVKGASVTSGYYQNPQANQEVFTSNGWFNTGDLGFLRQGRLTITGRQKDVIIINGLNYYCHEIEASVEEVEGVEVSYTAACAVRELRTNTDKLAIFFSTSLSDDGSLLTLLKEIRTFVVNSLGINPDYLIPVDREIIPKTSIGKIQRAQLSQRFNAGEFKPILKRVDILLGNANTIPDWFYRIVWKPKSPVIYNDFLSLINPTLVFLDSYGLGAYLCQILSQYNRPYITVSSGEDFCKIDRHYTIAPEKADHYRLLLESLAADNIVIGQILHLWTYDEYRGEVKSLDALSKAQEKLIYSLLFFVQALAKIQGSNHSVQLLFISTHIQSILSNDPIAYEKSTVLGLLKTIPQELHWLNCRHIDLSFDHVETNGAYILQELLIPSKEREVAYRNGQRFDPFLEKVNLLEEPGHSIPFKREGIYLLSGGLGGVGCQIAQYLLKYYQARLILVGRTPLPEKSTWNTHLEQGDAISQRIQAYQELEQLEGDVIYEAIDICNLEQLQTIVKKAKLRWGTDLDGIIHLAGIFHEQLLVEETQENLAAVLRPKMLGTWALHQLIKDNPLSIFINFSSAHGFFGSTAVGAYAAANSFLDSFSQYQKYKSGLQSYCFVWSMWDETGMSQSYQMKNLIRAKGFYAMPISQAISSMLAGLRRDCSHLFVGLDGSSQNIRRLESEAVGLQKLTAYFTAPLHSGVVKLPNFRVQDRFGIQSTCNLVQLSEMPLTLSGAIDRDKLVRRFTRQKADDRVAPRNQVEQKIAHIWQQILGIPLLSVHDNFFELGGNSLLATQLISHLRDTFSVELSLYRLFASPSVADLAHTLEALRTIAEDGGAFMTNTEEYEEGYL
ncbi:MAG: SDR family NAD(P)-dependent oxidoreductase [Scytonematopsis contorta HA4267-MV1]|jgi:acyl-CoA synthetase (AMP-forming)/AMP-acid ligase II/acyl carrier protein/NADP-dependent 3-hydroxy acid dehydrogenase YdfG|nr:SDR family NAD(P)-dependent oxidoreductase [Scytonematopsis contorta HA4267-MV1]